MAAGKSKKARRKGRRAAAQRQTAVAASSRTGSQGGGTAAQPSAATLPTTPGISRWDVLAGAALCLLVAISFFPATMGGFVWDDAAFTTVEPVQSLSGIWQIWFDHTTLIHEGHFWPLLYTTFWLEHKLWGFNPLGYHIFNLLLHGAVTVLLWRLLLRLAVPGAWFAAAVFAVHPLHAESVAWVIGRKDVMAMLFYLLAALSYLRFMESQRWGHYAGALALFVGGLLCKSIGVTLPVALLLWHWWKQSRVTLDDVRRVLPFLVLGLCITIADWASYKDREVVILEDYTLLEQLLSAAHALCFYVGKLLWPTELSVIYPRWQVDIGSPLDWGYLVAVVAVLALLWRYRGRIGRGPLVGALFFVVTLAPTLGFVKYGYMQFSFVADRYQYLAGTGVLVCLAAVVAHLAGRVPGVLKWGVRGLAGLLLAVLGALTWNHAGIYRDNTTFYSHIVSLNPEARNGYYNLAREYDAAGRLEEAYAAFLRAIKIRENHTWAYIGAGITAEKLGHFEKAAALYQHVLQIDPHFLRAYDHLGGLWIRQQRYAEALTLFQKFLLLKPNDAKVYSGLSVAQAGLNRHEEALRSVDRALALDPSLEEAHRNRATILQALRDKNARQRNE